MRKTSSPIEILGASSLLAGHLMRRFRESGYQGLCYSRSHPDQHEWRDSFPWQPLDAENPEKWRGKNGGIVISLIPIWQLQKLLPCLSACRQIIAFSSTSGITKSGSDDPKERALSNKLREAERHLEDFCEKNDIRWTILRPTLIYDPGKDANVSAIARVIQRWKVFPVASPASGLRQPVHADDLAAAAIAATDHTEAFDSAFNLTGGETLSYRKMVERIFQGMNRTPAIIPLAPSLLRWAMKGANLVLKTSYSPELFTRMNNDLTFDSSSAREKLGYSPRPFYPRFEELP